MIYSMEELLPLVKKLSEKLTAKESTSVTYETADRLMGAVIYCINEYTGQGNTDPKKDSRTKAESENAGSNLRVQEDRLPAGEIYERGYRAVIDKVMKAKALYEEITTDFLWYGNRALYDTVIKGMPAFFLYYDARFHPQDHILTLDYPVLRPVHEWSGVDAIYEYLTCIRLEQRFLSAFSQDIVIKSLLQYHTGYKDLFINLSSIVMNAAVENMTDIRKYAADHTKSEVKEKMNHALILLIRERFDNDQEILCYLQKEIYV